MCEIIFIDFVLFTGMCKHIHVALAVAAMKGIKIDRKAEALTIVEDNQGEIEGDLVTVVHESGEVELFNRATGRCTCIAFSHGEEQCVDSFVSEILTNKEISIEDTVENLEATVENTVENHEAEETEADVSVNDEPTPPAPSQSPAYSIHDDRQRLHEIQVWMESPAASDDLKKREEFSKKLFSLHRSLSASYKRKSRQRKVERNSQQRAAIDKSKKKQKKRAGSAPTPFIKNGRVGKRKPRRANFNS